MKKLALTLLCFAPSLAFASVGPYLQGEIGVTGVTLDDSNGLGGAFFNSGAGAGGRLSGGYLWGDNNFNYGAEMGALYYPDVKDNMSFPGFGTQTFKIDGYNIDLLGVLKYTFGDALDGSGFTVFGKAGGAYVHQHVTDEISLATINSRGNTVYSSPVNVYDKTGTKFAPEAVLGMGYQFNANFEMDLTGSAVFAGKFSDSNPASSNGSLLLGLTYHFA